MKGHHEEFQANDVEEIIEQFSAQKGQDALSSGTTPQQLMLGQLHYLYQLDGEAETASVERVWQRLRHNNAIISSDSQTIKSIRIDTMQRSSHSMAHPIQLHPRPMPRSRKRRLAEVLVAVLVLGLLVGGLITILNSIQQQGHPTTPTISTPTGAASISTSTANVTHTTPTPIASPTPIPAVQTSCPATGTARPAILPPLPGGGHQNIFYVSTPSDSTASTTITSTLMRYDTVTKQKVNVLTLTIPVKLENNQSSTWAIGAARISEDGQWIAFQTVIAGREAIQIVRADGQELQTLYCLTTATDLWSALSFSPNMKYLTFNELPIFGNSNFSITILELATGKQHSIYDMKGTLYEPIKWRDETSLYVNESLVGVGDTRDRHTGIDLIPDVTQDGNLQKIAIPSIPNGSGDQCQDFDFSPDATQLLTSDCPMSNSRDATPTVTVTQSTIEIAPLAGGTPHVIYNSHQSSVVLYARFINNTTIWFTMSNLNDSNQNGLWQINSDGTGLKQLTALSVRFEDLSYSSRIHISSDGTSFAFINDDGSTNRSMVLGSLNGSNTDTIVPIENNSILVGWSTL